MTTQLSTQRIPHGGDWLPLQEAVRLTGECKSAWYRRVSGEIEAARNLGRRPRAIKAPRGGGCARMVLWVRRSFDARLGLDLNAQVERDKARSFSCSEPALKRAWRRARWVLEWRTMCAGQPKGKRIKEALAEQIVRRAKRAEGAEFRVSVRSLQMWWKRYTTVGSDGGIAGLAGVLDAYGGAV